MMWPPDNSRNVLTWVRDEGGNEHWQIDMYLADGWVEAVPWRQEVLEWQELPKRINKNQIEKEL